MGWRRASSILSALLLVAAMVAGAGSLFGCPLLATVIKSNSMQPVYRRGDIALVSNWPGQVKAGDIVLFRPSTGALAGQWTMHRIVGQDQGGRYLTQGDAAQGTDQAAGLAGPVERSQIAATAVVVAGHPLKLPWLGSLALAVDLGSGRDLQRHLILAALVGMVLLGLAELSRPTGQSGRRPGSRSGASKALSWGGWGSRRSHVDARLVCATLGLVLSLLLVTMTLRQTIRVSLAYEVLPADGLGYEQPEGTVALGQRLRHELATVSNRGFLPALLLVSERDPNFTADAALEMIRPGQTRTIDIELDAIVEGSFQSVVDVSLVFPLLPPAAIAALARADHWLAALVGCLWPGLVAAGAGLAEPSARLRTQREIRRFGRRFLQRLEGTARVIRP